MEFSKLNPLKFGLAGGILTAVCVAITTFVGIFGLMGGFQLWNSIITDLYGTLGYSISIKGLLLGPIYRFIDGFIATWIFAAIYNKLI